MRLYFCYFLLSFIIYLSFWRTFIQKKKFALISVIIMSVILLPTAIMEWRWQDIERQGSAAVKIVSGNKDAQVKCQRFSTAFFDVQTTVVGHVKWDEPNIANVDYKQCQGIRKWLDRKNESPSTMEEIQGLHVMTHEAVHVSGEKNEAITECTAINRDSLLIQSLGGSEKSGEDLASVYYRVVYPKMKSPYILQGCKISPTFDSILIQEQEEEFKKANE